VPTVHSFDDLELDTALFELRRQGAKVPLEPQAFDVLVYLVSHRDRVVPKEELMDAIWGGRFVTETAVTSRIKQVRRAVGDDGQAQRVIQTVHGRGYRFVAPVQAGPPDAEPPDWPTGPIGPIRYTTSDGLHIAYQVSGRTDGVGPDIVLISGFASHLELDWADPHHAHFLHRLGSMGRLIRFDKRGSGMSDRPPGVPDLETRIHDVLAVMDAVGAQRALLFGYSEGGPMALLMAATHPERVASLVLYAVYAKRLWSEDYPWAQTPEEREAYTEELVIKWDWEADALRRMPSAGESTQRWWAHRMRASATPSTVRALMDMNSLVDVRDALPAVRVPTLVLHRSGDELFDVAEGKYIADRVAGAQFVVLEGRDHFVAGDPDQILDAVEPFITQGRDVAATPLALAALVALSGPGSDSALAELTAAGGRVRQDAAGRPVLLFDGPAAAVRAALAQSRDDVGVGIAVAEVEREATVVRGPGVREAMDIADLAPSGEVWLSATVGVLLAGSTIEVESVGNDQRVLRPV
jgi:pimeloyl-ACP methyl ester carboxylesterase/DNA-binding winged helix-turn-helix (wHTH) protein